jgi:predicted dehydrogenase
MSDRRTFMQQVLGGGTAMAVSGLVPSGRILGANDRVRFGLIGSGGRGQAIFKAAIKAPNTEAVAVADVYTLRLDQAKAIAPGVKTYSDFRRLLDDKSIDAVLIATPQHQHALNFVPAIEAGKDVYQEKTMAFNPDHARRMRHAFLSSDRVVQVGIQSTSSAEQSRRVEAPDSRRLQRATRGVESV